MLGTGSVCRDDVEGDQRVLTNGKNWRAQSRIQNPGDRSRDIATMVMLREKRCHTSMPAQSVVRLDAHGRTVLQSGCPFLNIFTRKMSGPNYTESVVHLLYWLILLMLWL